MIQVWGNLISEYLTYILYEFGMNISYHVTIPLSLTVVVKLVRLIPLLLIGWQLERVSRRVQSPEFWY